VDEIDLPTPPRMADAGKFVAAEVGMNNPGIAFCDALDSAQRDARGRAAEGVPFIEGVVRFMNASAAGTWEGSATNLLAEIGAERTSEKYTKSWPSSASAASQQLDEHATTLADGGIEFERVRTGGGNRDRLIRLSRAEGRAGTAPSDTDNPRDGASV
jgi:hypothetical protein